MRHKEYLHYQKASLEELEKAYVEALENVLAKIREVKHNYSLIDAFVVAKKTGRCGLLLSTVRKFNLEKIITIDEIYKLNYLHYFISEKITKGKLK